MLINQEQYASHAKNGKYTVLTFENMEGFHFDNCEFIFQNKTKKGLLINRKSQLLDLSGNAIQVNNTNLRNRPKYICSRYLFDCKPEIEVALAEFIFHNFYALGEVHEYNLVGDLTKDIALHRVVERKILSRGTSIRIFQRDYALFENAKNNFYMDGYLNMIIDAGAIHIEKMATNGEGTFQDKLINM